MSSQERRDNYKKLLQHPMWQKKRLEILNRDNFTCRKCGDTENTLHVHHCGYESSSEGPWDYDEGWLLTLCKECHRDETDHLYSSKQDFLTATSACGFMWEDYADLAELIFHMNVAGITIKDLENFIYQNIGGNHE